MSENDGTIDAMNWHRPERGRFVVNAKGEVSPVDANGLALPEGVIAEPRSVVVPTPAGDVTVVGEVAPVMGPTRVGEWLMVDVRVAKSVPTGSRLFKICQDLGERGHCGIVEGTFTLVIDLLEVNPGDGPFLLNRANWPAPK